MFNVRPSPDRLIGSHTNITWLCCPLYKCYSFLTNSGGANSGELAPPCKANKGSKASKTNKTSKASKAKPCKASINAATQAKRAKQAMRAKQAKTNKASTAA